MKINENIETCKNIAESLRQIAHGEIMKCPHCGEEVHETEWKDSELVDDSWTRCCPYCNEETEGSDWDFVSMYDYFENNVYDIEYRINSSKEFKSVRLMVAGGGPNIFIDTSEHAVKLYWWTDRAEYPLESDVCNSINEMFEELYNC